MENAAKMEKSVHCPNFRRNRGILRGKGAYCLPKLTLLQNTTIYRRVKVDIRAVSCVESPIVFSRNTSLGALQTALQGEQPS